jgi:PPP family 3-phenylpropionic acid transporter
VTPSLLSVLFFAMTGGSGSWVPFLGLYLERTGATGPMLAAYLATMPLARVVAAPLWSMFADRFRRGELLLRWCTIGSAAIAALVLLPLPPALIGLALLGMSIVRAPIGPVLDAMAVKSLADAGRDVRDYGKIRLWGSFGYLVVGLLASIVAGRATNAAAPLLLAVGAWALAALFTLRIPAAPPAAPTTIGPALRALAGRRFTAPYVVGLIFAGAGMNTYDALYAVHIGACGLDPAWTGAALGAGIATEMALMAWGRRLLQRFDPFAIAAAAMALGALRWALTAVLTDPWALTAVQASHGVVFGAFWLASVEIFRSRAPAEVQTSAQAILTTAGYGIGPLLTSGAMALVLDPGGTEAMFGLAAISSLVAAALFGWAGIRDRDEGTALLRVESGITTASA